MITAEKLFQVQSLGFLLPDESLHTATGVVVKGVSLDSRAVTAGDLFVAVAGAASDGRQYVNQAIERGAAAVLVEADEQWQDIHWTNQIPVIAIENLPQKMSAIAARFYQSPSELLRVIGITGTNGKTTCSLLLAQVFALLDKHAGVIGTIGFGTLSSQTLAPLGQQLNALQTTGMTTPDAISTQRILAQMASEMPDARVAMEVSSHSLVLGRVAAVEFSGAVFTNLTRDHLDFHGDMASYAKAKEQLLFAPKLGYALVNADDDWAKTLGDVAPSTVKIYRYSISDSNADIYVKNVAYGASGVSGQVITPWGEGRLECALIGRFNLSNLLSVIGVACCEGIALAQVLNVLPLLVAAPGRMQVVALEQQHQPISVIVDYAHTPDALENTLQALREHSTAKIWTVFGCGGNRDKNKRPLMGRIAERLSDYVIVTNDNPRTEEPSAIAAEILRGLHNAHACLVIADRAQAIDLAVQQAREGDIVLIAGKGHEDYQIFAEQTLPFSDVKQARLSLQRRLARLDAAANGEST